MLCGDLNTPRREHDDGSVLTFAHDSAGRLRPERGERWDAAERALVHTLRDEHGWVDAYRALHGYGHREASWTFAQDRGGWRLDHVLVHGLDAGGRRVRPRVAADGLSDHSALVVDLVRLTAVEAFRRLLPAPAVEGLTAADLAAEVPGPAPARAAVRARQHDRHRGRPRDDRRAHGADRQPRRLRALPRAARPQSTR